MRTNLIEFASKLKGARKGQTLCFLGRSG